jgi:hypothetical protein
MIGKMERRGRKGSAEAAGEQVFSGILRDHRSGGEVEGGEGGDDLLGFEGDGNDLADEAEDVAFVIFAVGVVGDAGAGVGGDAVLVDDPVEGRAVAEAVVEGGGWDAAEGEGFVAAEGGLVFSWGNRDSRTARHFASGSHINRRETLSGSRRRQTNILPAVLCLSLSSKIAYRIHR